MVEMRMRILAAVVMTAVLCVADSGDFRRELRAFYPDECHGACKDARQTNSVAAIGRELDAWAAAHPGFDALDIRREE